MRHCLPEVSLNKLDCRITGTMDKNVFSYFFIPGTIHVDIRFDFAIHAMRVVSHVHTVTGNGKYGNLT